jgi:hypothetical protein
MKPCSCDGTNENCRWCSGSGEVPDSAPIPNFQQYDSGPIVVPKSTDDGSNSKRKRDEELAEYHQRRYEREWRQGWKDILFNLLFFALIFLVALVLVEIKKGAVLDNSQ